MNHIKRFFFKTFLLTVCLFYSEVIYAYDFWVDGVYYNILSDNEVEVTSSGSINKPTGTLKIPETVKYNGIVYKVTTIGERAYQGSSGLKGSLIIPKSVTTIKELAFNGCSGFASLEIPNSVISIKRAAFAGCTGFAGTLTIPNSVTSIEEMAFRNCNGFTGLVIPNSITSIGSMVFEGCSGFTGTLTIPNSVTSIGEYAFAGCYGFTGKLIIPNSVISIGRRAFGSTGFTGTLSIPNTVTSVGEGAFSGCSGFTSLELPNSINTIEENTFYGCSGLTSLEIPNSIKSIKKMAFSGCTGLSGTLIIPTSITTIEPAVFGGCSNITSLRIHNSITEINDYAFSGCKKLSLVISEIITPFDIGEGVFNGISSNAKLQVPKGTRSRYVYYGSWRNSFKEIVEEKGSYTITIQSSGSGSVFYNGTTIRNRAISFTIDEGTSVTLTFAPDNGYRIKSAKVNNSTISVSNNQYTISSINANTTVSVEFEAIPVTTYTLSITASGNGSASYGGTTIRSKTSSFTVNAGSSAAISFTPDNGYRIKSVKVNNSTVSVSNNKYTISSINANTTVSVEFEAIPVTTYTLSITASGNGSASYSSTTIRNKTSTFTVNAGSSATITFTPNNGYRIKSVKVNNTTVSVSNNQYTISNINANTTVSVEFEAIPVTTYTLSISASGNGSASYNGTTVRGRTSTFTINDGSKIEISLNPDNGYRLKSIKENNTVVTSYVYNSIYTISSLSRNTSIEVEFEAIPSASEGDYNTFITCLYRSSNITKNGSNVQNYVGFDITNSGNKSIYITKIVTKDPDTKEVLATSTDTSILGELQSGNTKGLSVKLNKDIVPTWELTYTYENKEYSYDNTQYVLLYITSNKYGSISFMDVSIGDETKKFSIKPGADATIEITPGDGCVLSKLAVNGVDMISSVVNNKYKIGDITSKTTVSAVFDKTSGNNQSINGHEYVDLGLPSGRYWATVNYGAKNPEDAGAYLSNSGIGNVANNWGEYWRAPTKEEMQELLDECEWTWTELNGKNGFHLKGPNGNSMFLPAAGKQSLNSTYYFGTVAYYLTSDYEGFWDYWMLEGNSSGISLSTKSALSDNYPVRPISTVKNESVFSTDGLNFSVISANEKTANLAKGNYGKVLEVPVTVKYPSTEWKIVGIDKGALSECDSLAAVIWNPEVAFTENVANPNLLLYVRSASYAPSSIKNVVVNGTANSIVLLDASGKNDFYCPKEFTAQKVSYTHHYTMETGLGNARGWETIALPFDVQKIEHKSKGEIVPFANWKSGDAKKPFWLMTYGTSGWAEASSIKANTPYIISMPNHSYYKPEFRLNGNVTFSAENITIPTSENLHTTNYNGRTFIPNYMNQSNNSYFALNVNNDYVTYSGDEKEEGSKFLIGKDYPRAIHPFEAYMTSASQTRSYIAIGDDMTTGIGDITEIMVDEKMVRVYNLNGQLIMAEENKSVDEIKALLSAGVYIVNGKKLIIK